MALHRAHIAAILGDNDRAMALLRDVFAMSGYGFDWHRDANFDSLRDDPRFQVLINPQE